MRWRARNNRLSNPLVFLDSQISLTVALFTIAVLIPTGKGTENPNGAQPLLSRLAKQPIIHAGGWSRDALCED